MQIAAAQVKELRERSGAGMMECKKALVESGGDVELAFEHLRKSGIAKAAKKSTRVAAEGVVVVKTDAAARRAVIVEVNCETDFVTRRDEFTAFADAVADTVLAQQPADTAGLSDLQLAGSSQSVEAYRTELVAKIGENIAVRRFAVLDGDSHSLAHYLHGTRIGVVVALDKPLPDLGRDIAMHIAWSSPMCIRPDEVPGEVLEKEREIFAAQAADSGKPPEIVRKMVEGKLKKYMAEVTLLGQPFVKDQDQTVAKVLAAEQANVVRFVRYEVGEGVEKKAGSFVDEVKAQARSSETGGT